MPHTGSAMYPVFINHEVALTFYQAFTKIFVRLLLMMCIVPTNCFASADVSSYATDAMGMIMRQWRLSLHHISPNSKMIIGNMPVVF